MFETREADAGPSAAASATAGNGGKHIVSHILRLWLGHKVHR
jgi:hypothetical protein